MFILFLVILQVAYTNNERLSTLIKPSVITIQVLQFI